MTGWSRCLPTLLDTCKPVCDPRLNIQRRQGIHMWDEKDYFLIGIVVAVLSGFVLAMGLSGVGVLVFIGAVGLAVAQAMVLIGIIAVGVRVGVRQAARMEESLVSEDA